MWIHRDISEIIHKNTDVIQVIRGPRQCGKSSLLLHLDPSFQEVSLDDPSWRELAQSDPELFLKQFGSKKLFIDEAQYAPALFPSLKRKADLYKRERGEKRETILRLTGSNQILMNKNVKESLAGRASFFDMNTLSVAEILAAREITIQEIIYCGGWPEIHANHSINPKKFLDDYINSYVEKDIVLAAGIQKSFEFLKFIKLLAGRIGNILDLNGLGQDTGVDSKTIKEWISVLERMRIVSLVQPYSNNLSSRLIKSPKVYFLDTGLACRLQGWGAPEQISTSPQQGALFENLVFQEIYKLNLNYQLGLEIFHWRSRDGEEIDFLIKFNPKNFVFIEAKVSRIKNNDYLNYPQVRKIFGKNPPPYFICHQEGSEAISQFIPIALLKNAILKMHNELIK